MGTLITIGIFIAFLLAGMFAGAEVGFVSLNRLTVELRKKQRSQAALTLSKFLDEPTPFISAMIVGIIIALTFYGLLVGQLLEPLWKMTEAELPVGFVPYFMYIKIVFDLLVATALFLICFFFCRGIFRAKSDTLMFFMSPLLGFFYTIFHPIANSIMMLAEWILKNLLNVPIRKNSTNFTRMELEQFIQQDDENDAESQELNTELFEAALTLPYVKLRQCLVPRKEIESISVMDSVEKLKQRFVETKLSKLVVFDKNIDNIVGYVHQISLFKQPTSIRSVMLPIPAVPESMTATDLMNLLIKERKSMAWVVDEFGGTSGIVTMEDLLEELFGEIKDEYDVEELIERETGEGEYEFSGRLEVDHLNERYQLGLETNGSETLSGYIIQQNESIPRMKEKIIIGIYEFEILDVSSTRIDLVRMRKAI
ncbi:MAG: HlyC/CorC family transporter [Chitinophagia bacterium]|jgi:CBS domain containing-hemolysin-like protein|nr:HlyC/CorC family transporter [Chitinophagia bacterium]